MYALRTNIASDRYHRRTVFPICDPPAKAAHVQDLTVRSQHERQADVLTHAQIWSAIDRVAARAGLSASGLARRAGLDPTTFNKSKRTRQGRARWPSTESIARALAAANTPLDAFMVLIEPSSGGAEAGADALDQTYFYKNNLNWFAENDRGAILGGPFQTYDGLLRWVVEKEFGRARRRGLTA
jgi:transcriptional regulator with XRE-family HTH domain